MSRVRNLPSVSRLFGASVGFLSRAGSQLCALAVTILATRVLGVADFGAYAIASSVVTLSRTLYYVGTYEYLLKTPEDPRLKGSCLLANVLFALGSSVVAFGFAEVSPFIFGGVLIRSLVLLLAPSLFIAALVAWLEALILRRQRLGPYYAALLFGDLVAALATAWAFHAGYGVFSLVFQAYVRLLVVCLCYARFVTDARGWRQASLADVGTIMRWSWPRYASVFLNYWSVYGADLLLGALLTPAASGLYRASNRIVSAASDLFSQPLLKMAQTRLAAYSARGKPSGRQWLILYGAVATFGWTALGGLAVFAPVIVGSVLGQRWLPAVPIVMLFCVVRGVTLIDSATTAYLACANQQRFTLRLQSTTAVCMLAMSAALARFGPLVVSIGAGMVMIGGTLTVATRAAKLSGVTFRDIRATVATALVPLAGVLATVAVARLLGHPTGVSSALFVAQLLISAAGGLLGLFLIRDSLARAAVAVQSGSD